MTGTAKGVFVISFMVAIWATGAATAGTIEGTIKDAKTGDPLAAAAVSVVNSNLGATTDLDGKYSIPNINPGSIRCVSRYDELHTKSAAGSGR